MPRARIPIQPGQIFGSLTAVVPAGLGSGMNFLRVGMTHLRASYWPFLMRQ
jgi:hypothetical protein